MSNIDLSQLEQLVEQDKFDEARDLLLEFFRQPMTAEERGQAYLDVASVYLDIANYFNKQRAELLESSLKGLEDLDKQSKELDELIGLDNVRKRIQNF